jgi:anti-sigma regulatory factor (Ser/Thr protein kinase)
VTVDVRLHPVAGSVPQARAALDVLRDAVSEDRLEDLRLVVSELVTNSIRHAGLEASSMISLRVSTTAAVIRVEIHDDGPGFDATVQPASMYQESGWGLYLIAQLSDRWGATTDAGGTTVWLEIDR